jgi:hypothetical protein
MRKIRLNDEDRRQLYESKEMMENKGKLGKAARDVLHRHGIKPIKINRVFKKSLSEEWYVDVNS